MTLGMIKKEMVWNPELKCDSLSCYQRLFKGIVLHPVYLREMHEYQLTVLWFRQKTQPT